MIGANRAGGQGDSALTIQLSKAGWTDVIYLSVYQVSELCKWAKCRVDARGWGKLLQNCNRGMREALWLAERVLAGVGMVHKEGGQGSLDALCDSRARCCASYS